MFPIALLALPGTRQMVAEPGSSAPRQSKKRKTFRQFLPKGGLVFEKTNSAPLKKFPPKLTSDETRKSDWEEGPLVPEDGFGSKGV